jgi:hypothetical protein
LFELGTAWVQAAEDIPAAAEDIPAAAEVAASVPVEQPVQGRVGAVVTAEGAENTPPHPMLPELAEVV